MKDSVYWRDMEALMRKKEVDEAVAAMADKEQEQERELAQLAQDYEAYLQEHLTERELRLIANCCTYAANDPAGLPGHNLMIIVAKLANLMGIDDVPD